MGITERGVDMIPALFRRLNSNDVDVAGMAEKPMDEIDVVNLQVENAATAFLRITEPVAPGGILGQPVRGNRPDCAKFTGFDQFLDPRAAAKSAGCGRP